MPPRFIIYAPDYDEDSGGSIALHLLYARLNALGIEALIWNSRRPVVRGVLDLAGQRALLHYKVSHRLAGDFNGALIRYANQKDVAGAIVVYPEIVAGNPLGGRHVVRWFLNKPGVLTGEVRFGADDLCFYYMKAFDEPSLNRFGDNELCLTWTHPAYVDRYRPDRSGSCCMMRKGASRGLPPPDGAPVIDGLSHAETARIFNEKERFVCFDLYTRYMIYAALAGCTPVIVPQPGLSAEQWMPNEDDRYGVAYGEENIPWALSTRPLLLERLARQNAREDGLLRRFVERSLAYFASSRTAQLVGALPEL